MANRYKIETHPQRMQIESDIIAGKTGYEIANNYDGISEAAVKRYRKDRMPEMLRHAELENVDGILRRINENMLAVESLYSAVREFLEDPDNPGRIVFNPHASEIDVTWEEYTDGKVIRHKDTMQDLMSKVPGYVSNVKINTMDPRVTMLRTAEVLNKQLELLCRTKGLIQEKTDVNVNIGSKEGNVYDIVSVARRALAPWPDAMQAFIDALIEETTD